MQKQMSLEQIFESIQCWCSANVRRQVCAHNRLKHLRNGLWVDKHHI